VDGRAERDQLGRDRAGEQPVAQLGRVQPVDRPRLRCVDAGHLPQVDDPDAVRAGNGVEDDVERRDAGSKRSPERPWQPEHPVVVVVLRGDHGRPRRDERADDVVEVGPQPLRVEVRPHRVVHADQQHGDVGPQRKRGGQLRLQDPADAGPADRQVREVRTTERLREQWCETTPSPAERGIPDAHPDRVAEHGKYQPRRGRRVHQHGRIIRPPVGQPMRTR
jgi:hypothetical protein